MARDGTLVPSMQKRLYGYLGIGLLIMAALLIWHWRWSALVPTATPTPAPLASLASPTPTPSSTTQVPTPTVASTPSPTVTATATHTPSPVLQEMVCAEIDCDCAKLKEHDVRRNAPGPQPELGPKAPSALSPPTPTEEASAETAIAAAIADTPQPMPASSQAGQPLARGERLFLANYFPWYDADGWDDCNLCDQPQQAMAPTTPPPSAATSNRRSKLDWMASPANGWLPATAPMTTSPDCWSNPAALASAPPSSSRATCCPTAIPRPPSWKRCAT